MSNPSIKKSGLRTIERGGRRGVRVGRVKVNNLQKVPYKLQDVMPTRANSPSSSYSPPSSPPRSSPTRSSPERLLQMGMPLSRSPSLAESFASYEQSASPRSEFSFSNNGSLSGGLDARRTLRRNLSSGSEMSEATGEYGQFRENVASRSNFNPTLSRSSSAASLAPPEIPVADDAPRPTQAQHASPPTTTSGSNDHPSDREIAELQQAVENSLYTYHQEQATRSRSVSEFPQPVRPWEQPREQPPIQRHGRLHRAKRLVEDFVKGTAEILVSIRNDVNAFLVSLNKNTDSYVTSYKNGSTVNGDSQLERAIANSLQTHKEEEAMRVAIQNSLREY